MMCIESIKTDFRFDIEYLDEGGEVVRDDQLTLTDFAHAVRDARFHAFRRGSSHEYDPLAADEATIEPVFQSDSPSPQIQGFAVTIRQSHGVNHTRQFETRYFSASANRLRAERIRSETMTAEQELYYRVNAFLDDQLPMDGSGPTNKLDISLTSSSHNIATGAKSLRSYGVTRPWDDPCADDLPVLMDHHVLEEAVEEARSDPEREVAGFLLGRLHRDPDTQQVFVAVTGLASASGTTEASGTSVTYTPASFAQVKDVIKLRNAQEMICGWYHSHPFKLCAECPLPTPPECIAKVLFYSHDDIDLMQTTFEQPFMVGLLTAVEPRIEDAVGHLPVKLYGWRNGAIRERGFDVMHR